MNAAELDAIASDLYLAFQKLRVELADLLVMHPEAIDTRASEDRIRAHIGVVEGELSRLREAMVPVRPTEKSRHG